MSDVKVDNVLVANEAWQLSLPKPEPSLGIAAYRRERRAALLRSPRKLWNYRCYLRAQRTEHLDYLPIKIDIENVFAAVTPGKGRVKSALFEKTVLNMTQLLQKGSES